MYCKLRNEQPQTSNCANTTKSHACTQSLYTRTKDEMQRYTHTQSVTLFQTNDSLPDGKGVFVSFFIAANSLFELRLLRLCIALEGEEL